MLNEKELRSAVRALHAAFKKHRDARMRDVCRAYRVRLFKQFDDEYAGQMSRMHTVSLMTQLEEAELRQQKRWKKLKELKKQQRESERGRHAPQQAQQGVEQHRTGGGPGAGRHHARLHRLNGCRRV